MTKDRNRNNLKHETKEWKKYRSYSLVTNAGWKGGEERKTLTFLSRTRTLDHRILRSEVLTHSYRFLVNEPRSTGSAGSSCIVLRSSMSKVSCLKIHSERKEISSSFVTKKKKSFLTNDRKRINPFRQIRLNDKLDINADMLINITGLEEAYLSSHEGSMKLQHFWFQYHLRHLSVWTITQLFMASLTASKLSSKFSKRQRAKASDFSSDWKITGSVTIYS